MKKTLSILLVTVATLTMQLVATLLQKKLPRSLAQNQLKTPAQRRLIR